MKPSDFLIIGGGLAGTLLAYAIAREGFSVSVIDKPKATPDDNRGIAISHGSAQILQELGLWPKLAAFATTVKTIHVSDRGHFGFVRISHEDEKLPALGYVIAIKNLLQVLHEAANESGVIFVTNEVKMLAQNDEAVQVQTDSETYPAKLAMIADGADSPSRTALGIASENESYDQSALIASLRTKRPHQHTAYERFTADGPLALLPSGDHEMTVVWVLKPAEAQALKALPKSAFCEALQQTFGYRAGKFEEVSTRQVFPLERVLAAEQTQGRLLLFGSASHHLHPVAAQGFNLCIRDSLALVHLLKGKPKLDATLWRQYETLRQKDQQNTASLTHSLVHIFSNNALPLVMARNVALSLLDRWPFAKTKLNNFLVGIRE